MSKLIKIGLVVVISLGVLALGYWFSNRDAAPTNTVPPADGGSLPNNSSGTNVPSESLGASKSLFKDPVLGYFANPEDLLVVDKDGRVLKIIGDRTDVLSSSSIFSATRAYFSFDGKRILLETGFPGSPFFKVFDVDKGTWKDLPPMHSPAWSPKTHEIIFLDKKTSGNSLSTLNVDSPTPTAKVVAQANLEDVNLFWPQTSWVMVSGKGSAYAASSAWKVDLQKKTWTPVVVDRSSLDIKWKKDGSTAIVLTGSGRGGRLTLINDRGEALRDLNVLTLPQKCVFDGDYLLCAIPEDSRKLETSFLPDDYLKESFFTRDSFLEISLSSGEVESLSSSANVDAIDLQAQTDKILFINRLDGKLYSIKR